MKPVNDAWAQLRARPAVLLVAGLLLAAIAAALLWGLRAGAVDGSEDVVAAAPAGSSITEATTMATPEPEPDESADRGRTDPFRGGPASASGGVGAEGAPSSDGAGDAAGDAGGSSSAGAGTPSVVERARAAAASGGSSSSGSSSGGGSSSAAGSGSGSGGSSASGSSGSSSTGSAGSSSSSSDSEAGDDDASDASTTAAARTPTAARPLRFSVQLVWPGARRQVRDIALGRALPSTKRALFRIESANVEKRTVRIALQRRARLAEGNSSKLKCIQRDRGRCALVDVPLGRNLVVAWAVLPQQTYKEYRINVLSASRGGAIVARARTVASTDTEERSGEATIPQSLLGAARSAAGASSGG